MIRLRAAVPIVRARSGVSARRCSATSAPSRATSTSWSGRRNISTPSQASVIRQAPAPAASNTRVAGEKPTAAIESRATFSTARLEVLKALWSLVPTCPTRRTFSGIGLSSQPLPPIRKRRSGRAAAALRKNSSTRASRSGRRLPRKDRSAAKRGAAAVGHDQVELGQLSAQRVIGRGAQLVQGGGGVHVPEQGQRVRRGGGGD